MKKLDIKKDIPYLFAAFLIPLLLMAAIHACIGVWPFGERSILVLDLNGQYVYYFEALKHKVLEGGSLFYTWSRAMGGEFMGIFAYYVASPFALIPCLFPDNFMTEGLITMILLKTGLSGATMAFYLDRTGKGDRVKTVVISTMYALSSYAVVQAHNTMWIDALVYLPLLTYGLESLISKHRFKMFVIILTLTLTANYYIGFMICIYVLIYSIYYYIAYGENNENNFYYEEHHLPKSILRVGGASLIAGAMSSWVLMPAYYSLTFGKTTFTDPSYYPSLTFNPLDLISKFFIGSYDTVEPSGLPFVYCGTLMLILLPVYFFSKRFSARKKISAGILLTVFCISFSVSTIDIVWHGFQHPNWLNYRYSFIFIFLALIFSHRVLCELEKISFRIVTVVTCVVVLISFIIKSIGFEHFDTEAVVGTFACCVVLLLTLHAIRYGYLERGGVLILCVVIMVEMFCGGLLNTNALDEDVYISSRASYNDFMNRFRPIVESVQSQDDGFYRMEKTVHRKTNDNFTLNMKGLSNSTSTLNEAQIEFLDRMGYASRSHWSKYLGGTPVSDSLLGIKYIISDKELDSDLFEIVEEDEANKLTAYLNPYALPIAYGVSSGIKDVKFDSFKTPFERMNTMVAAMTSAPEAVPLFKEIPIEDTTTDNLSNSFVDSHIKYTVDNTSDKARITFKITAVNDDVIYMYIPTDKPVECDLTVNSYSKGTYFANETKRIVELGSYSKGTTLFVTLTLTENYVYILNNATNYFYYLDKELYTETMTALADSPLNVTAHSDTKIKGNITVSQGDDMLFTTIPYDEGWRVKIDGKRAELIKTADSMLAVSITPGEHTVEMIYLPNLFVLGIITSVAGFIAFGISWGVYDKKRKKRVQKWLMSVDINS
ncbi:MAG: YfhO family protein [Clostridia bacterium]|nr:YfhO family protein [Clostridia bacterium]